MSSLMILPRLGSASSIQKDERPSIFCQPSGEVLPFSKSFIYYRIYWSLSRKKRIFLITTSVSEKSFQRNSTFISKIEYVLLIQRFLIFTFQNIYSKMRNSQMKNGLVFPSLLRSAFLIVMKISNVNVSRQ